MVGVNHLPHGIYKVNQCFQENVHRSANNPPLGFNKGQDVVNQFMNQTALWCQQGERQFKLQEEKLQQLENQGANTHDTLRTIENSIAQLENDIASMKKDRINARTEINPKEQCNSITRSGKEYGMKETENQVDEDKGEDVEQERPKSKKGKEKVT